VTSGIGALLLQVALPNAARPAVVTVGILYFVVIVGISVWAARRTRTASDFFVAGKGIGLIALTVASVSVSVSGFAFIGGPGFIYAVGLGAMYIVLPAAVTNVMGAWVLAKRMRLLGEARALITIPDAIGARYRSRGAQGISAVAILVGIIGYIAVRPAARSLGLGPRMRRALRRKFEADARQNRRSGLSGLVGEVSHGNRWLRTLVRREGAIALDFPYFQPSLGRKHKPVPFVLYYQPLDRERQSLGAAELRRLLYTMWRRTYRIARPLSHPEFLVMLRSLEGRRRIGQRVLD